MPPTRPIAPSWHASAHSPHPLQATSSISTIVRIISASSVSPPAAGPQPASRNRRPRPSLLLFEASLPSRPPLFCCIYNISHSNRFLVREKTVVEPLAAVRQPRNAATPRLGSFGSSAVPQDSLGYRISPSLFFHSPAHLLPAGTPPAFSATIRRPGGLAVPCAGTTGPRHPKMFHVKHSFAIPTTHSPRHERCPLLFFSFSCTSFPRPPCLPLIDRRFSSTLPPPSRPNPNPSAPFRRFPAIRFFVGWEKISRTS